MPTGTAAPVIVPLNAPALPGTTDAPQMDTNGNWLPTPTAPSSPPDVWTSVGKTVDTIAKLGGFGAAAQAAAAGTQVATGAGPGEIAGGTYDKTVATISQWVWYAVFAVVALVALVIAFR